MNLAKYIIKNYRFNKKRNNLNAIGIASGIILIMVINFVAFDLTRAVNNYFEPFEDLEQIVQKGTNFFAITPFSSEIPFAEYDSMTQDPIFSGATLYPTLLTTLRDLYAEGSLFSVLSIELPKIKNFLEKWPLMAGNYPSNSSEILFGTDCTTYNANPINSTIEINGQPFKIVGILQNTDSFLNSYIIMDFQKGQEIFNRNNTISSIYIKKADLANIIQEKFENNQSKFEQYIEETYKNMEFINQIERDTISGNLISLTKRITNVLITITLFCGLIITFSNVALNFISRNKELAYLKAMGISDKHLFFVLFSEIFIIISAGILLGIISGNLIYATILKIVYSHQQKSIIIILDYINKIIPVQEFLSIFYTYLGFAVLFSAFLILWYKKNDFSKELKI